MKTTTELDNYRRKILSLLKNNGEQEAKKIIQKIAGEDFMNNGDLKGLYDFFSPIYDELFYDLSLEKLKISKETKNLLETLSLPFFKMEKNKVNAYLKKLK